MKHRCLLLLFCVAAPLAAQQPSGDRERGLELYLEFACYSCHGYNGTGRTPLSRETSGILGSEALFVSYLRLRADQNPINPRNTMPNYDAATLSDQQAIDIYAYLLSLSDDPPEIEEVPALMDVLESAERRPHGDSIEN